MNTPNNPKKERYDIIIVPDAKGEYQIINTWSADEMSGHVMNDTDLDSALEANSLLINIDERSLEDEFYHVQRLVEFWLCTGDEKEKKAELISIGLPEKTLEGFLVRMNLDHLIYLMDSMPIENCIKVIEDVLDLIVDETQESKALELFYLRLAYVKQNYRKNPFTIDPVEFPVSSSIAKLDFLEKIVTDRMISQYEEKQEGKAKKLIKPAQLAELTAFIYYGLDVSKSQTMASFLKKLGRAFEFEFNDLNAGSTVINLKKRFRIGKRKEDWSFIDKMFQKARAESSKFKAPEK